MCVVCSRAVSGEDYINPAPSSFAFAASAPGPLLGEEQCFTWFIISDGSLELDHSFTVDVNSAETPSRDAGIDSEVRLELFDGKLE